ncbi:MAG: hypothetical protein ACOYJE_08210 [Bacteroidaceae bacterium]
MIVGVIIVLYNSENANYANLIGRSGIHLILVDNTPGRDLEASQSNITYIPLKENRGIAAAQNVGIHKAEELGCTHVLFFDQDSSITILLVKKLLNAYLVVAAFDPKVAVVGPLIINRSTGLPYKTKADLSRQYSEVRELISSGSVVALKTFQEVGSMMELLFIDGVDFEWCWRARSMGYRCYLATGIPMKHMVGRGGKLIFRHIHILFPAPDRYYYLYRNWQILMRMAYVPWNWKAKQTFRRIMEFFFIPFLRQGYRFVCLRNMLRGWCDGIKVRSCDL